MVKSIILTSESNKNVKGILTVENTSSNTLINLKTFNLNKGEDKLVLAIKISGETYKVELNNEENYLIEKNLNLNNKISAVILKFNKEPEIILWGSNETTRVWKTSILNEIIEKPKSKLQRKLNEIETQNLKEDNYKVYNNDYETDEEIETIIDDAFSNDDFIHDIEEDKKINNENDFLSSIESQINELLNNYNEETALENIIPNSKFVKVNNSNNYYIFGVIYEENKIRYIVYGLPGEFSVKPEDEYSNLYQWLPLNAENPEGYGYYLMYQDALTGEQIDIMFE